MITAGMVFGEIADELRQHDDEFIKSIKKSCQLSYYEIWGKFPVEAGRREVEIDFADADTEHTMLLPADLVGVEAVIANAATGSSRRYGIEYVPGARYGNTGRATYAFKNVVQDALAILTDVSVVNLASVWTGGTWDASYIGEYVRFGSEPGIYKITAENAFTPRYYGKSIFGKKAMIRPSGTRRMMLTDENDDYVSGTVMMYYWSYPSPLYMDNQDILLPASRALELATFIRMLGSKDRRESDADRYRAEYREALDALIAMNPRFSRPMPPTNMQGDKMFDMRHGANYYRRTY